VEPILSTPEHCYNDFYGKFKLYANSLDSNELLKYGIQVVEFDRTNILY
jgi:hypothetical protein